MRLCGKPVGGVLCRRLEGHDNRCAPTEADPAIARRIALDEGLRDVLRRAQRCRLDAPADGKRDMSIVITLLEDAILRNNACTVL